MKITGFEVTPLKSGRRALLQVRTSAGITGLAEAPWRAMGAFEANLRGVVEPLLLGTDPRQIDRHWETLYLGAEPDGRITKLPPHVVGTIDIALWDILGKDAGLPCHALMGGAARLDIPLYWSVGEGWRKTPDQMVSDVEVGLNDGYKAFKIRMDWRSFRQDANPGKDYEMFKQVRDFLPPDLYLGFDVNNGYSVSTALQQGRKIEDYGRFDHYEEPIPQ